jgi:AcrR family transcriptional regulator
MEQAATAPAAEPAAPRSEARERLLETASRLFYEEGINSVGVDRLTREAQVTRATFYRHFPGKDDLVVAYLRTTDAAVRAHVELLRARAGSPRELLLAFAGDVGDLLCRPGFRGCPFINAAAEFADTADPVRAAIEEHRVWMSAFMLDTLRDAGHPAPEAGARQLMMLRDGAMVAGYLADGDDARGTLVEGVERLLPAP